jgi:hypothetical protein
MAQRIAYDTRDWTRLRTTATMTGDAVWTGVPLSSAANDQVWVGGTTAFNLPANYQRMLLTTNVWRSSSTMTPMTFMPNTDEWTWTRARNWTANPHGEWTIMGGKIHLSPALYGIKPAYGGVAAIPAETASFTYLDKNCVALSSGGYGDSFLNDLDTFVLDERILKLGMIWQWKANKGSSYAEDMGSYQDALAVAAGHDSPAPIIIGRMPISSSSRVAYPYTTPG